MMFGRGFYLRGYLCHKATSIVGDEVLIRRVEEGDRGSGNGDGGHSLSFLVGTLVLMLSIFIGGVLFSIDEGSRLFVGGDLVVIGPWGELGESFGEWLVPTLWDKPSTMIFSSLKHTIRDKMILVTAILACSSLCPFSWALGESSWRIT